MKRIAMLACCAAIFVAALAAPAGAERVKDVFYSVDLPKGWAKHDSRDGLDYGPGGKGVLSFYVLDRGDAGEPKPPASDKKRKVKPLGRGYATMDAWNRGWQLESIAMECSAFVPLEGAGVDVKPFAAGLKTENADAQACIDEFNTPEVLAWLDGKTPLFAEAPAKKDPGLDAANFQMAPPEGWTFDEVQGHTFFHPSSDRTRTLEVLVEECGEDKDWTPAGYVALKAYLGGYHPIKAWQGGYLTDDGDTRGWLTCMGAECVYFSSDSEGLPDLAPLFAAFKPATKAGEAVLAVIGKPEFMGWLRRENDLFKDVKAGAWLPVDTGNFKCLVPPGWIADVSDTRLSFLAPDKKSALEIRIAPGVNYKQFMENAKAKGRENGWTNIRTDGKSRVLFTDRDGNAGCLWQEDDTELLATMKGESEERDILFESVLMMQ